MKFHVFTILAAGAISCGALSACSGSSSVSKAALDTGRPAPRGSDTPTQPTPPPPAIETFAQSLETFTFTYDRASRQISASFTTFGSTDGIRVFEGEFPSSRTNASLSQQGGAASDFRVQVQCTDESCRSATVQIDKLAGALAGRAILKRETREMLTFGGRNLPAGRMTTSHDSVTASLAELTSRDNLGAVVTGAVTTLEGGRHTWCEVRYDFLPQPLMRADQPGYFDDKSVVLKGEISPRANLKISRSVVNHGASSDSSGDVFAKAEYSENPLSLRISIERADLHNPSISVSE